MADIFNFTDEWTGGGEKDAINVNVTDTLSDAESRLLRLRVDNVEKFTVRKDSRVRYGPDANNHWSHLVNSVGDLAVTGVGSTGGALTVTPAAGKNFNVLLSGAGDFIINSDHLYVDTSKGYIGMKTTSPAMLLNPRGPNVFPDASGAAEGNGILRLSSSSTNVIVDYGLDSAFGGGWIQARNQTSYATSYHMLINPRGGNVGIGMITAPSARLHVISTTEQFRLGYDASNYWTHLVNSVGDLALTGVGAFSVTPAVGKNINFNLSGLGKFTVVTGASMITNISDGTADATSKSLRLGVSHYNNAQPPMGVLFAQSSSTLNTVNVGGGSAVFNAATSIRFLTAANNTTTTGTERMQITSDGEIQIASGGNLKLGVAAAAETPAATHTLLIKDSTGTSYKVLCLAA